MNTLSKKNRSYVPNTTELNDAIASYIRENESTPDVKKVRETLLKEHSTWRLPERRVRKFVKRQAKEASTAKTVDNSFEDDNASVSSVSSVTRRMKGIVKGAGRLFGAGGSSSKRKAEPLPVTEVDTKPILPPMVEAEASYEEDVLPPTPNSSKKSPKQAADTPESTLEASTDRELTKDKESPEEELYKDDNDGKKGRPCAPCEGCVIL